MKTTMQRPLSHTAVAIGDLFEQTARLSLDLLETLSASSTSTLGRMLSSSNISNMLPKMMPRAGSCCNIPPPCWAPQPIGDIVCHVCPGGTATLRLRITNCGATRREIKVEGVGKSASVSFSPASLALGPMEREFVTASLAVPADAGTGQEYEALVWVRGCQNHYLRWIVSVASRGASCCHEVDVEDCPDLVHHWYDHFYCEHPCGHQ